MRGLRRSGGRAAIAALASALALAGAGVAFADNVVNNGDNSIDNNQEIYSVVAGNSVTVGLFLQATTGDGGGPSACNVGVAGDGKTATVTMDVGAVNSGLSATAVIIDTCDDPITNSVREGVQNSTLTAAASVSPGSYTIPQNRFTVTNNGGTTGSYAAQTAAFQVTVSAPPDSTGPVITKIVSGTSGSNGWYTSNVTVSWSVSDLESPVVIDSGCGTQNFTSETPATSSSCTAHSAGGSSSESLPLKIDKTGPSATLSPTGVLGLNGWFTSDVTVATSGSDSMGGQVTCTADQSLTDETPGVVVNGSCTNEAGLKTDATPVTVKIDKTGPSASLGITAGTPGSNGWYVSDVTVSTTGEDDMSGPVSCTAPVDLTTDTSSTPVNGSCTNEAGITTPALPLTVKVDKTDPDAHVSLDGSLSATDWYVSDVIATTSGSDTVSKPVTCTAPQTFGTDGVDYVAEGDCTNDAGRTQHALSDEFRIDQTAPEGVTLQVASGTLGANGWYTSSIVVETVGSDVTSGVVCTLPQPVKMSGTFELTGSCTNGAGLITEAEPLTVRVDMSPPTASLEATGTVGANGWYTSNVKVLTVGEDETSGATCTAEQDFTQNTDGTLVSGSCINGAGVKTDAADITIKIDKDAPTNIQFLGGISNGDTFGFSFVPAAPTCTASDAVSGLDACSVQGYSTSFGDHTLTASAIDNAGNTATREIKYTVVHWNVKGFYAPVDMDSGTTKILNTVKNGSTVPLKFEIFSGATELTTTSSVVQPLIATKVNCGTGAEEATVEILGSGATALRYDTTTGQFVYNWKTPTQKSTCWDVKVVALDGTEIQTHFSLK